MTTTARITSISSRVRRWGVGVMVVVCLVVPATASADVLVNAIYPATVGCGTAVMPGIWYQAFSGGPRWAQMTIKNRWGVVVWRRSATATTTWRYWRFRGACGRRYVLTYKTAGGTVRFPFHIRG